MESSVVLAVISAGIFFLVALLTGVWKYVQIRDSEISSAHPYVDIAHRAALMYSFAALLLARFAEISQLSANIEWWAVFFPVIYFAYAIAIYIIHGFLQDTENQLAPPFRMGSMILPPAFVALSMWSLVVAEIGGFVVLFYGVLAALLW
jgi:hypothetical protein